MNKIPNDVSDAVRMAASEISVPSFSLDTTKARGARLRRRRQVLTSVGVGAVTIVTAAGATFVLGHRPATRPSPTQSAATAPAIGTTSAQRLVLNQSSGSITRADGSRSGVDAPNGFVELLPDGTLRTLTPPRFNAGIDSLVALPDGGQVLLGIVDLRPGVKRPDGEGVVGIEDRLVAQRPDGSIVANRNVRIHGETVRLIGADARSAVLWRSSGIVEHDILAGTETSLPGPTSAFLGEPALPLAVSTQARLVAGSTGQTPTGGRCSTVVLVGYTGTTTPVTLPSASSHCALLDVRFSPTGDALAVAYAPSTQATPLQARLAVFDSQAGRLIDDQALYTAAWPLGTDLASSDLRGLAWLDERTVRAAVDVLPDDAHRTYRYQELLTTVDLTIRS
jgi:hypothetical protein